MNRKQIWLLITLCVSFIFALWAILEYESYINIIKINTYPIHLPTAIKAISSAVSLLLTFVLVLIYLEQTSIQERQEKWMQANHTPKIEIQKWSINLNKVKFEMVNLGNGIAKNMSLLVELEVDRISKFRHSISDIGGSSPLRRKDIYARSLEAGQSESITCTCVPEIDLVSDKEIERGSFSKISTKLVELGSEQVECTILIKYEYINTETKTLKIWHGKSVLEKNMTIEQLVEKSYKNLSTDINIPPDNP
ncbi:hypothetical protein NKF26_11975 [Haladaptatus sp. AB618]|uniref:hypothetical protein n=1 Tax=Haladaptatus sp. AB618 TaxID=2934173 RepID=UPI00209C2D5D|nr:hypothetical protein [Haladaptatus sp. AB618]MCO8254520.1 hypothetical protein [Haladaptatus sp. AB618]